MNEFVQGWFWTLSILMILVYATLYWIGGRPNGRLFKRVFAPLWLSIGLLILSGFDWRTLFAVPIWFLEVHLPRGKNTFAQKIIWRSLWALFFSLGAIIFGLISHNIPLMVYQASLCFSASIFFGILNPFDSAPKEEAMIALLSTCLLPFIL